MKVALHGVMRQDNGVDLTEIGVTIGIRLLKHECQTSAGRHFDTVKAHIEPGKLLGGGRSAELCKTLKTLHTVDGCDCVAF